jgi:thioesterase domain-containing protein
VAEPGHSLETLVPLQPQGDRPPLFFVTPGPAWLLRDLVRHLGPEQPFYALQPFAIVTLGHQTVEVPELARAYVRAVRGVQPDGPYQMAGISTGGAVALEMAHQMAVAGLEVSLLAIIDALARPTRLRPFGGLLGVVGRQLQALRSLHGAPSSAKAAWLGSLPSQVCQAFPVSRLWFIGRWLPARLQGGRLRARIFAVMDAQRRAERRYQLKPFPGKIVYFWCRESWFCTLRDPRLGWREVARGGFILHRVPGYHHLVLEEPHVRVLARKLRPYLRERGSAGP